jgi:hypothetical protein
VFAFCTLRGCSQDAPYRDQARNQPTWMTPPVSLDALLNFQLEQIIRREQNAKNEQKAPQLTKSNRRIRTRRRLVRDRLAYLGGCAAPISKRCPAGVPDRGPSPQLVCTDTRAHDAQMAPPWLRVGNPTQPWGRDDPNCVFLCLLSGGSTGL